MKINLGDTQFYRSIIHIQFPIACTCNTKGSISCSKTDGTCHCYEGYSGVNCDTCSIGYMLSNNDTCTIKGEVHTGYLITDCQVKMRWYAMGIHVT